MSLHSWLRSLRARIALSKTARRVNADAPRAMQLAESLEARCLLAVTPILIDGTDLIVQLESGDDVAIQADSAGKLEVLSSGAVVIGNPDILTADITSIMVTGGDGSNRIDLTGVTTADFDAALTITVNGGDGSDTIIGSEFADSLVGGNGADSIIGGLDNDTLEGSNGNDTLSGGVGDDSILGGDGADSINGDVGNDTVLAGNGADNVSGGDGTDSLNGNDGSDTLNGDAGDDTLSGDNGTDSLLGGADNDSILGGTGNDTASGGDGNDTLNGGADNDSMNGDAGTDSIDGGDGNDTLLGGDGNDTVNGGTGNDCVIGSDGNDSLLGGAGSDQMYGDDSDQSIVSNGNDTILGQAGNDKLFGGGGGDSMDGGAGDDVIRSGDVDTANGVLVSVNDVTVVEGTSVTTTATFTVSLSKASANVISVPFTTVDGSAVGNGVDYNTTNGTLVFQPGVTQLQISVPVISDGFVEQTETFAVRLTTATNGAVIVQRIGTATIIDDDVVAQGPAPVNAGTTQFNGCIQTIVAHPTNPDILYAGAVNGGIWRTDNGSAASPTWTPQTDFNSSLAIGSIAFDLTDPTGNTLIAGTGPTSSYGGSGSLPAGLLLTTNGGTTWTEINPAILQNEVIISTTKSGNLILAGSDNIYVSAFYPFLRGSGLFRSTDGGATFTLVSGSGTGLPAGPVNDIVQDPAFANRYYATIRGVGIFRSDDGGATWANVTSNINVITNANQKLELAIHNSPGNNVIFAGIVGAGNGLQGLFRSTNGGASWTALDRPAAPFGQGFLHFSIAANPTNPNLVYVDGNVGGVFRVDASLPANSQVTSLGSSGHPDSREMTFDLNGNLWNGGDGGLYRLPNATTATTGWQGVANNMQVGEVHNVAYDNVSHVLIRGAQDNGTAIQNSSNSLTWTLVFGGDGAGVEVDDTTLAASNQSIRYYSAQFLLGFTRATYDANNNLINTVSPALTVTGNGAPFSGQFTTPLAINTVDARRLLIGGGNSLYETLNQGNTITEIGPGIVVNGFGGEPLVYGGRRNGVSNPDVLYAGSGNRVFVRTAAGSPVVQTATPFPGGTVSDIILDPNDWMTAYVAGANNVYRTTDAGATWTNITGNLNVDNIHTIEFIPGATPGVVIGARLGVFSTLVSTLGTWSEIGATALPNAPVWELDYNGANDTLYVAEFGRGIFSFPNISLAIAGSGGSGGGGGSISIPLAVGDTINGGDGNDTVFGADGNDLINGMAGNDSLVGGAGLDSILGGSGNDSLDGSAGDDTVDGQGGNDLVKGGDGQDTFVWNGAGDGVDTLSSLSGYDRVRVQGSAGVNNFVVSQASGQLRITDGSAVLNVSPVIQVVDILAGDGDDVITIGALDRVRTATILTVNGGDGNDTINSNGANIGLMRVSLIGGLGDDSLTGSAGIDSLDGGDGDDLLDAQGGNDLIFGGLGDDTILGGAGNDRILAGDGADSVDAGAGDDSVTGDVGADTINGGAGNDTLDAGDGTDTVDGGDGNDSILGGNDADSLNGNIGNDTIRGGASDDTITGENGNDKLYGDDGNDSILGHDGDDTLNGGDGDDTLDAGNGNDLLGGGNGDDVMNGAAGNDTLTGGDGNDTMAGGAGRDVLLGDEGDDSLNGQGGFDTINPGEGSDTVFDPTNEIDTTFTLSAALLAALA